MKKASDRVGEAKALLRADDTSPSALLAAAQRLAPGFEAWEPETVWLELERQGIDLSPVNRDKLMAATALALVPAFYWDGVVFEKTALAFSDVAASPDVLEEATPAQLAWAVHEAEAVRRGHGEGPIDYEHEPIAYTAIVLHRAGFVVAPPQLEFAQVRLDAMTKDLELKKKVVDAEAASIHHPFSETPVDVQRAYLAAVAHYVEERKARAATEMARLR